MSSLKTSFPVGEIPHAAYPRPQLRRETWQNLNGMWNYCIRHGDHRPEQFDGTICVPFAAESQLSGVHKPVLPQDSLWYSCSFSITDFDAKKRTLLHFGAVDYCCTVYINDQPVGSHVGGYTPFSFDITDYVTDCENTILLCVRDKTDCGDAPRGKQVLHPEGIWYTAVTGIWQTVWLEQVAPAHFTKIHFCPHLDCVEITAQTSCSATVHMKIWEGEKLIAAETFPSSQTCTVHFESPHLWSPEDPFLYRVILTLSENDRATDTVESYFGLRTFAVKPDDQGITRFFLNDRPYFQKGLLDQGYWPDGLYTAPNDDALRADIENAKSLGFNMLRKHIKVEPARWYYYCDVLGMLVWQDMPSGAKYPGKAVAVGLPNLGIHLADRHYKLFRRTDAAAREQFLRELTEIIDTLKDTVCISTWVPFNEGWGQFDSADITARIWAIDPSRPVDSASGWHDQGAGDYKSQHTYIVKIRAQKSGGRAYALTEYGGYSQIIDGHCWDEMNSFGYKMFPDREALSLAYQRLHEEQVFPLIQKGLCVSIYTQLTDVELEVNGIYTYDRAMCKLDPDVVRAINAKLIV